MEARVVTSQLSRRQFVAVTALFLPSLVRATRTHFTDLPGSLASLEQTSGGRLGVAILDTSTGERSIYRADERFPMCSTFKFLLASAVLRRVDRHQETADRALPIPPRPLLSHSPLTETHAGGSMTIAALCHAIITQSDNTAANLLLETIGGPTGVTRFARSIGDAVTRLDRTELSLNEGLDGDPRDTTSPASMLGNLQAVLLGGILSAASRNQLTQWMQANLTGLTSLRARLPPDWRVADKTGANGSHTRNDIAVIWPPGRPPIIVTAYITQCSGPESKRENLLATIGNLVAASYYS
jgi:beta-lactamase class A